MNNPDIAQSFGRTCKVLKAERGNHGTTSLYLEDDDENFKKRQANQY